MENVLHYGLIALYLLLLILVIKWIISTLLKQYHSNWHTLIDNFEYSPNEFYERLKKELQSHGVTNISIRKSYLKEGNVMSHTRIYLRATWKEFQYDICACKFGHGFFVSWWLLYKNSLGKIIISKIPFIGQFLARVWYPITYYKVDTASMFMTYAHASVLKVIDDITNDKGVRSLSADERKPILNNVFKR